MAKVIKAPNSVPYHDRDKYSIFLAGSIDMGNAVNWQERFEAAFEEDDILILNPRRDDWDSTWVQDISNPQFKQQVVWELDHIDSSDLVVMYFDPNGQAPITLLELGICAASLDTNIIVCCPPGYWRRGNVQIVCEMFNITLVDALEDLINETREWLVD